MATLQNIGKLKYRGKDGQWHPLPVVVQDADGSVSTISGKGAPTSATQGEVNQLYRDEDTQRLYICTATDGGYTWAEVSGGSVGVDATLTKAGYAADAKAAGDAIGKKIDAPQTAQVGEVLTVEEVDAEGKPKKWKTTPAAAEQVQADWNQNDEAAADYVRNRPFYTEIIEKTFESNADNKYINFEGIPFKAGDNVDIMVDGERLTLVAQSYNPAIVYIGDSFNELSGGTGQYGWTYYYVEQENLSVIESSGNHIFVYREPKIHKMEMKYSPVKLMSENAGEKYSIDRLYISENIDSKGLVLYYDEEEERYTLAAHDNNMNCSTTLYLAGNKNITDILNQEKEFEVSGYDIKSICENDLLNFQYYRIVIDAFVLNNRGYYVVISTTDDNQYTSNSLAGTKHYIGTFATVEGYLYKAELEIQCEDGDRTKFKSGKIKVKRIL